MYDSEKTILPLSALTLIIIIVVVLTQSFFANDVLGGLVDRLFPSNKPYVLVDNNKIFVDIADTPTEWQLGLSDRKNLGKNEGMFFIFDRHDTRPSFWMEGMKFGIDIIWINDEKIVQIDVNVSPPEPDTPSNELPLYTPFTEIDYVLEVNEGFVKANGIAVGDKIDLSNLEDKD